MAQHVESLDVLVDELDGVEAVTLVDDSIVAGTQMVGALIALRRAGFDGHVCGFTGGHVLLNADDERAYGVTSEVGWFEGHSHPHRRLVSTASQ